MNEKIKKVCVILPIDVYLKVSNIAKITWGKTLSDVIREAIEKFLNEKK